MGHDVFISYSSKDKSVADAACATLESRKIRCWIAPRDVLPGVPYAEALIDAIGGSRVMVLVFSAGANDSPQVMREVERAVNKGIPIIPFRIENVMPSKAMEYFISSQHWLDALTPPLERHLERLGDTVQLLMDGLAKAGGERVEPITSVSRRPVTAAGRRKARLVQVLAGLGSAAVIAVLVFFLVNWLGGQEEASNVGLTSFAPTPTSTATPTSSSATTPTSTTAPPTTTTPAREQGPTPLTSGTSVRGELTFPGEVHWYTFTVEAADTVHIVLTKETKDSSMVPWLGLLDPEGSVVYEGYSVGLGGVVTGGPVQIDRALAKIGKYTVRVRSYANEIGTYMLSFFQASKANNPISSGSSIQGQLPAGEVHWYTFDAAAGDTVHIMLSKGTKDSAVVPWLGLLAPDASVVYEGYSTGLGGYITGGPVQVDQALPKAGKYTIRVRDQSLRGGPYALSFNTTVKP